MSALRIVYTLAGVGLSVGVGLVIYNQFKTRNEPTTMGSCTRLTRASPSAKFYLLSPRNRYMTRYTLSPGAPEQCVNCGVEWDKNRSAVGGIWRVRRTDKTPGSFAIIGSNDDKFLTMTAAGDLLSVVDSTKTDDTENERWVIECDPNTKESFSIKNVGTSLYIHMEADMIQKGSATAADKFNAQFASY